MPRRRKYESRKGFTLVEMIVVLLILAVVTSMAVPAFSRQIDDAKEKRAVTEAQACVTAGTGLGAQLYSTAHSNELQTVSTDANASDITTKALAAWASKVQDNGPELTGSLALTEGQGQYYLKPGNLQNGIAAGADKLKNAAGVDGTVENFWCSGTGQIVYLRYLSADGILVAYTNNGTSGSKVVIPTPDVPDPDPEKPDQPTNKPNPPTTTPTDNPDKPDDTDHSGDLIFVLRDEFTDEFISGVTFNLYDGAGNLVGTQTTDSYGKVCFPVNPTQLGDYNMWKLVPETIPTDLELQDILPVTIGVAKNDHNNPTDFFLVNAVHNENSEKYGYKVGYTSKYSDDAKYEHVYNFYVRHLPKVEIRVVDDATQQLLSGVKYTLSRGNTRISVDDSSVVKTVYAKMHENDKLPEGATDYIELFDWNAGEFQVKFSEYPEDFQYFEDFYISIYKNGNASPTNQIASYYRSGAWNGSKKIQTVVTCENENKSNVTRITIHATQVADVTFHKYSKDDLSLSSIPELSGAHLQLYKADSNNQYTQSIENWNTDSSAKVITLEAGAYRLEETSAPQDYTKAEPLYFTLMRNTSGKLELQKGVSDANSYVDDAASSVIMVDTPTVKQVQVQIVDITTGKAWIGVDAQLTGGDSGNMSTADKKWTISSLDNTMHTFRLPLKAGTYTIKIEENTDFVYSEFKFKLVQNGDSFSVEDIKDEHAPDGKVSNNTITMYAYPKVYFYYSINYNNNYDRYLDGASLLIKDSNNTRIDVKGSNAKNPWDIKSTTQGKVLGIATGSYTVSEENRPKNLTCTPWNGYTTTIDDLTPVKFSVKRDQYGHPEIYDSNGYKNWQKRIDVVYQFTS